MNPSLLAQQLDYLKLPFLNNTTDWPSKPPSSTGLMSNTCAGSSTANTSNAAARR